MRWSHTDFVVFIHVAVAMIMCLNCISLKHESQRNSQHCHLVASWTYIKHSPWSQLVSSESRVLTVFWSSISIWKASCWCKSDFCPLALSCSSCRRVTWPFVSAAWSSSSLSSATTLHWLSERGKCNSTPSFVIHSAFTDHLPALSVCPHR